MANHAAGPNGVFELPHRAQSMRSAQSMQAMRSAQSIQAMQSAPSALSSGVPAALPLPRPPMRLHGQDAPPSAASTPAATPTRPRRPTRTPRDQATPTPVPMMAGALRLTWSVEPARPVVGADVAYVLTLLNQGDGDAPHLTLETGLPNGAIIDRTEATQGQVTRDGAVVRWTVDAAGGERAVLRMSGLQARDVPEGVTVCALLISAGSPIEHCAQFETGQPEAGADRSAVVPRYPTVAPGPLPVVDAGPAGLAGWGLLFAAMAGLGMWWGGRRPEGRPPDAPDSHADAKQDG